MNDYINFEKMGSALIPLRTNVRREFLNMVVSKTVVNPDNTAIADALYVAAQRAIISDLRKASAPAPTPKARPSKPKAKGKTPIKKKDKWNGWTYDSRGFWVKRYSHTPTIGVHCG